MNDLEVFFNQHSDRLIDKWNHYFPIYDRHFSRFRGQAVNIVEFGVSQGGSLQMWRDYFGPQATIWGVDINPNCKRFEESNTKVIIGDQEDRSFLREFAKTLPPIDILIDDGGHTMRQQINTFEELFGKVQSNGVYLIEDLHTSYWKKWGGGYKKSGTFIEYSKNFIDQLNAWHSRQPNKFKVTEFTRTVASAHYYDSVLVLEKKPMSEPTRDRKGNASFPDYESRSPRFIDRLRSKLKK
jgi:hypothetical protein